MLTESSPSTFSISKTAYHPVRSRSRAASPKSLTASITLRDAYFDAFAVGFGVFASCEKKVRAPIPTAVAESVEASSMVPLPSPALLLKVCELLPLFDLFLVE